MIHARDDYNRIQDPEGKIPEDEPVFLLRGQDVFAPRALRAYALLCRLRGRDDLAKKVEEHIVRMQIWQLDVHQKLPDL